jgi:hypothetical protein
MSGLGIAERYTRKTRQLRVKPPEEILPPTEKILPPAEEILEDPPLTPKQRRLTSQIETIVFSTFKEIGNTENSVTLRRKYCDKLRSMDVPESDLHPWCRSTEIYVGPAVVTTLDDLEGGRRRRRRRQTRRKTVKRRRTMRRKSRGGGSGGV